MDSPRRLRLPAIPPNLGSSFLFGALVALLNISDLSLRVGPGLDPSWNAALHMAAFRHVQFGDNLVFSYGPLGFLQQSQLYFPWTAAAGHLYVIGVQLLASTVLVQVLRRHLPLPAAVAAAFLIARVDHRLDAGLLITATIFVVCVTLLRTEGGPEKRRWMVLVASAIGGIQLLIKFNQGVSTLAIVGIVCLAGRNRRFLFSAALAAPGALVLGWLITGNDPTQLPGWIAASFQTAAGYSETMGIPSMDVSLELVSAAVLLAAIVLLSVWSTRGLPGHRRVAVWLVLASFLFFAYKQGFVRDNPVQFAAYAMVGLCAFLARGKPRYVFGAALAFPFAGLLFVSPGNFLRVLNPIPTMITAGAEAKVLASPGERSAYITQSRDILRTYYGLEPSTLELLEGHSFHVYPWEALVAWAYPDLDWDPLPVFQAYNGYTPLLDNLNADRLQSDRGPERILRERDSIDHRNPDWESPAAMLKLVCNYRELRAQERWQVLGKAPDRCGKPHTLSTVRARTGEPVPVPEAEGEIVLAKISGFKRAPLFQLRTLLWKAPALTIKAGETGYRMVPGTAGQGLIMSVPEAIAYSGEFALGKTPSLELEPSGSSSTRGDYTIEFVGVPVTSPAPPSPTP